MPKLRIGKPQLLAGLLLLLYFCDGGWVIENKPADQQDSATLHRAAPAPAVDFASVSTVLVVIDFSPRGP
mgnify:CR=1 FL=1